jgi:hypothetical protein
LQFLVAKNLSPQFLLAKNLAPNAVGLPGCCDGTRVSMARRVHACMGVAPT